MPPGGKERRPPHSRAEQLGGFRPGNARRSGHAVQVYADLDELAESVATYLSAGFEAGEPAVVVATREHVSRFAERLAAAGWDERKIQSDRLLVLADADATLAKFMDGELPSATAFEAVMGGLLDRVAERFPRARIRVFGEMVDLLAERGQTEAAVKLEQLWKRARAATELLAALRLPDGRVRPLHADRAATRRVRRALPRPARRRAHPESRVPVAQLVLMWVSANMPGLADRILASARTHYFGEPLTTASI